MPRFVPCALALCLSLVALAAAAAPRGAEFRQPSPAGQLAQGYGQYDEGWRRAPTPRSWPRPAATAPAYVYLLHGFMNVFSLGMDDLAERIEAHGLAATVANHADAEGILAQIVNRYAAGDHGPIILIGHSLGADAVITMADALARNGIPVALAVLFDGTAPHSVPGNVVSAINFTQRFDLTPGPDFRGALSNVDLRNDHAIDHFNIDKVPALQAQTLDAVMQAVAANPSAAPHRP